MLLAGRVVLAIKVVMLVVAQVADVVACVTASVGVGEVALLYEVHSVFDEAVPAGAQAERHERDQPNAQKARRS